MLDDPRHTGLSFFFLEESSFFDFAKERSLPEGVIGAEKTLRAKYDLLQRYWVKLHYHDGRQCGMSQYFQIDPRMHYPISTIRRFLREYGFSDVAMIEELLKPALESPETQWGFALKRGQDRLVPRVFCSIERPLLKEMLLLFVRFRYLEEEVSQFYLKWDRTTEAGDRIFLSFDPPLQRFSSVDFTDVPSSQFPDLPSFFPAKLSYLKARIFKPSLLPRLSAYMPLKRCNP